ncbi:MAG: ferredoxin [Pseudomonadota bacterium]
MTKIPSIDMAECVDCGGCVEICPTVFKKQEAGYIQVMELTEYPEEAVQEAINICPTDCITWKDSTRGVHE